MSCSVIGIARAASPQTAPGAGRPWAWPPNPQYNGYEPPAARPADTRADAAATLPRPTRRPQPATATASPCIWAFVRIIDDDARTRRTVTLLAAATAAATTMLTLLFLITLITGPATTAWCTAPPAAATIAALRHTRHTRRPRHAHRTPTPNQ